MYHSWNHSRNASTTLRAGVFSFALVLLLVLSGCGSAAYSDQPGGGLWRVSDVAGSVPPEDVIRLQDDFAAAANQSLLADAQPGDGTFRTVLETVRERKKALLADLAAGSAGNERSRALKVFADLAADWAKRDRDGLEPLRPYVEAVESISSLEDLTAYECDTQKNPLCLGILMPSSSGQSQADPSVCVAVVSGPAYSLGSEEAYFSLDNAGLEMREKTNRLTEHILSGLGYDAGDIDRILQANYRFEKKLAGCETALTGEETKQMQLTFSECVAAAEGCPMKEILSSRGFPEDGHFFMNTKTAKKMIALRTEQNLEEIRGMLLVHLVTGAARFLDRETYALEQELEKSRLMPEPEKVPSTEEEKELDILFDDIQNSAAGPILDELYVDRYVDSGTVDDLTKLTQDILAQFRLLFSEETWLTEDGRAACLEKLDALRIHVLVPDFDMMEYTGFHVIPGDEGGTFLQASFASKQCLMAHDASLCAQPFDRSRWDPALISTTQTNAFYMPTTNGIYILAGIAEAPVYTPQMSYEQKLGGIGTVIGHEITHGFDKNGAQYDKDGIEQDWLPVSDSLSFSDRCSKVSEYYNTIRPFPGASSCEGYRVAGEATADMGGLRITLALASGAGDFEYDAYFRQFASIWAQAVPEDVALSDFQEDEHPLGYLRVNVGLQQFDEFMETYGIQEGDGMYLPQDKRIAVW